MNRDRVSVWEAENILEMDGGDGGTTMEMYLMPLNCTSANGKNGTVYNVNFTLRIFDHSIYKKPLVSSEGGRGQLYKQSPSGATFPRLGPHQGQ